MESKVFTVDDVIKLVDEESKSGTYPVLSSVRNRIDVVDVLGFGAGQTFRTSINLEHDDVEREVTYFLKRMEYALEFGNKVVMCSENKGADLIDGYVRLSNDCRFKLTSNMRMIPYRDGRFDNYGLVVEERLFHFTNKSYFEVGIYSRIKLVRL